MKAEWSSGSLPKAWLKEQQPYGDAWRVALVNPLVYQICRRLAVGESAFDFSAFDALADGLQRVGQDLRKPKTPRPGRGLAGVHVVDLGCGEGCLGDWVKNCGASYFGLDSSDVLVKHAQQKRHLDVHRADLEAAEQAPDWMVQTKNNLSTRDISKALVTSVILLDHMETPERLMSQLGAYLGSLDRDVPVLVVTLDASRFDPDPDHRQVRGPGLPCYQHKARIESITSGPNEVDVYLYSRGAYERLFRDAGFFVRACEPLHFSGQHRGVPSGHEGISRLPTFWAWRLSAHRKYRAANEDLRARLAGVLSAKVPELYSLLAARDGGMDRLKFFQVAGGEPIVRARNLGGELTVLMEGAATLHGGNTRLSFGTGDILGELESASGSGSHFPHDVLSDDRGCTIAVVHADDVDAILKEQKGLGTFLYRSLRDRLQLVIWRHGANEVASKGWGKDKDVPRCVGGVVDQKGKRTGGVAPQYLWRAARALLWAAAIERRSRTRDFIDDMVLLKCDQIGALFQPAAEDAGHLRDAFRLFHFLRLVDAFPGFHLLRDTAPNDAGGETVAAMVRDAWRTLVQKATSTLIVPHLADTKNTTWLLADISAKVGLGEGDGIEKNDEPTPSWQTIVDETKKRMTEGPAAMTAVDRWKWFLVRAHAVWKDHLGNRLFFILRDVSALQEIGLGSRDGIAKLLIPRARYLVDTPDAEPPQWIIVANTSAHDRKCSYVRAMARFLDADLHASQELRWSADMESWRSPSP